MGKSYYHNCSVTVLSSYYKIKLKFDNFDTLYQLQYQILHFKTILGILMLPKSELLPLTFSIVFHDL